MVRRGRRRAGGGRRTRRAAALAVAVVGSTVLAACGSSSSSTATTAAPTPTTSGGAAPTTAPAVGTASGSLCGDAAAFSGQLRGLEAAVQTAPNASGGVAALRSYAQRSKPAFDETATRITAELGSAPAIVQSAWSSLRPQVDQLFAAAVNATSVPAVTGAAASIEAANSFVSTSQTLSAFASGVCPSGTSG